MIEYSGAMRCSSRVNRLIAEGKPIPEDVHHRELVRRNRPAMGVQP